MCVFLYKNVVKMFFGYLRIINSLAHIFVDKLSTALGDWCSEIKRGDFSFRLFSLNGQAKNMGGMRANDAWVSFS